jgi:flavin-dependent dehydrogenase
MIVTLMTDFDLARRAGLKSPDAFRAVLDRTRHIKARLLHAGAIPAKTVKPWIACSQRLDRIFGSRWLAVGDAACAFDPLSAQGILKALNSGLFASYAIADFFRGVQRGLERYGTLVEQDFDEYLEARAAFFAKERRWPASNFWKRRQQAISLGPEALLGSG